jgi:hypothetical protein
MMPNVFRLMGVIFSLKKDEHTNAFVDPVILHRNQHKAPLNVSGKLLRL